MLSLSKDQAAIELNGSCPQNEDSLTLSWHSLSVWVKKKNEEKSTWLKQKYEHTQILNEVSGIAEPGTLVAIMGPSGAGKTTLLATISQRLKGDVEGNILVNGKSVSKSIMTRISGFVPQKDLNLLSLTVYEHLQLMAQFKMDRRLSSSHRKRRVLSLLTELGLSTCANTRLSALSGGERKKVSLAAEMLTDPPLLFCDEPTTGLDSYSACTVLEKLRQLAVQGKTVVCSIHQPASGIFDLFHSVILLAPGGQLAFQGDPQEAFYFFSSLDLVCPTSYNLAEFLVTQLSVSNVDDKKVSTNFICSQFHKSTSGEVLFKKLEKIQFSQNEISNDFGYNVPDSEFQKYELIKPPKMWTQLYWLVWRSFVDIFRNPQDQLIRLAFYMFIALLISTPYVGLTIDQKGIQNMQGFLYLVIVETIFTFAYSVYHTFPSEIPMLLREISNGLYSPGPYYLSKMIVLLPRAVIEPTLFSILVFYVAGLFGGIIDIFQFCVPVIACAVAGTAYGCLISAMFESIATGSLVAVPIEQISLLFCGIYLSLSNAPVYLSWIKYMSMFYFGIEAVSILQWSKVDYIPCSDKPHMPCLSTGDQVLHQYGYRAEDFGKDLLALGIIYLVSHTVGFIALKQRSKQQAAY